jgi:hypothetical protein
VLVMARVLVEVEETLELLRAWNELNAATPYGRYFHMEDEVIIEDTVLAEELAPGALFNSIGFVAWAADNAREFLVGGIGEYDLDGSELATESNEVDLENLAQPIAPTPAQASDRRPGGVVSAGGYL